MNSFWKVNSVFSFFFERAFEENMKLLNSLLASALGHQFDISQETATAFQAAGIDTSSFRIVESSASNGMVGRGINAYAQLWQPVVSGGPITVPYALHFSVAQYADNIQPAMTALENDLACFDMPYVADLSTTTYENGIIFVYNPDWCFSALGLLPGYFNNDVGKTSVTEFGAPAGWQVINLDTDCAQSLEVVQHEVLHALGFLHEQSRPDRDDYIIVYPERTTQPGQWEMMLPEKWYDTGHIYEPRSLMSYSSKHFAKDPNIWVATLKDGSFIHDGPRITTTDALQVQQLYCVDQGLFPDFEYKETTTCQTPDEVGAIREVFIDRFCDQWQDCPSNEDEDGTIVECAPKYSATPAGCCGGFIRTERNQECLHNPDRKYGDKDTWDCEGGYTMLFYMPWWSTNGRGTAPTCTTGSTGSSGPSNVVDCSTTTRKCAEECIKQELAPEGAFEWNCKGNKTGKNCFVKCANGDNAGNYRLKCLKKNPKYWKVIKGTKPSCGGS
ncbi:Oidioi.mRNA.OKI2018_I69.chr1.g1104.t1.cds [Oikopleura dioica]|uniref:Metalloendopeptidase n=1 Tax=Oikopleura dioica TaxID=34765 RepID=A0ABN7SU06_OIKDI|nr:Oidioi.mRNA.OKI2018_I69.chr1.g1104.t1.cds [Oikopleura dioica]